MILQRYISRTMVGSTLLVMLVLMGLEILISFIGELAHLGKGEYGLWQAIQFVIWDMPYQIYHLFPMASLLGSMIGLGFLASHSELIAMRAAGFSNGNIIASVLLTAFIMVATITLFGELLAPRAERIAEVHKTLAISGGQALSTQQGTWLRADRTFVHIDAILPGKHLRGIRSYQFDSQHHLVNSSYAKEAFYENGAWMLQDVTQSFFSKDKVRSTTLAEMRWNINPDPKLLRISTIRPDAMSLVKLLQYAKHLEDNGLRNQDYLLSFWKRLFQPLASIVMIFIALPFVFGSLRNATMGLRLVFGIILGFVYYILNQFFGPLSLVYQIPPIIAAVLPVILFSALGVVLLKRTN